MSEELLRRLDAFEALQGHSHARSARLRYVLIDVFTERPLEGNQLAIFTDARALGAADMQRIARELKLSESVFALPAEDDADLRIRIFTPAAELPFAGHPVLGSAIFLGRALAREQVSLQTGAGAVSVRVEQHGPRRGSGWMSQPLPRRMHFEAAEQLQRALGVERYGLPVELYENGPRHVFVELESDEALAALDPDLRALAALGEFGCSCFAGSGERFRARVFAPALGVAEDPATGSAAGPLAVHLARHGRIAFGRQIEISQGAEIARPSLLYAVAHGDAQRIERVEVGGSAVILAAGVLEL